MKRHIDIDEVYPAYSFSEDKRGSSDDTEYDFTQEEIDKIDAAEKAFDEKQEIFESKLRQDRDGEVK